MYYTEIPMNITTQLDSAYYICTKFSGVGAGINVHNLANYKNTSWDDGVYVFCGMGPHFQSLLCPTRAVNPSVIPVCSCAREMGDRGSRSGFRHGKRSQRGWGRHNGDAPFPV